MLPLPITLELTVVYCRYGCTQEFYTLVLLSPFALEPSSCTADTDARRSSPRSYSQQYHPIDDIHHVVSAILTNGEDHICPLTTVSAPSSPTINISVF